MVPKYWEYTCLFKKKCSKSRKCPKLWQNLPRLLKSKTTVKYVKRYKIDLVFNFIIEINRFFLHVEDYIKVVIFQMRFLNLVHCDKSGNRWNENKLVGLFGTLPSSLYIWFVKPLFLLHSGFKSYFKLFSLLCHVTF